MARGLWIGVAVATWALASGARAKECTRDDDCGEGFECDLRPAAGSCSEDGDGNRTCDPSASERRGRCEPREMTCDTDADCLQGLFCVHGDDVDCSAAALPPARDVDAGSPRPEPASCSPSDPSEGVCTYRFAECAKDGDCSGGFVCSALGEPNELHCFPPRVDCETDDDCDGDTRCAALSDDAREDPPAAWEGATALCVPEAIALLLEERVMAAGIGESASKSGGSQSDANASDDGDDRAPVDGDSPQTDANSAGSEPAREATDSGCAVTHAGAGGANAAWLSLLGVAALVRRRH